ncbi:uncharacterized protein CMC5_047270 [Chondromyces crocatus]|uniref:HEPN domain-containing protein n=1 Tax=Chondromyces crocatus TaxID=52 RepID=A0A0K1EI88_CHOCO|nr:uncharacterized protein CMC5_047270 [Chondromyces crocatus]
MNYGEAARRHHRDAETLFAAGRHANADHLYGIAAECALLGILRGSPAARKLFDAEGTVKEPMRRHVNVLWNQLSKEAEGLRLGKAMGRLQQHFSVNPFTGWSVRQRYLSDQGVLIEVTEETLLKHRKAAELCVRLLDDMRPPRTERSEHVERSSR